MLMKLVNFLLCMLIAQSCQSYEKKTVEPISEIKLDINIAPAIGQYVTGVTVDSKIHIWFGTLEKGIGRYDGDEFRCFTREDGLPTNRVTSLYEDEKGIYWLNTGEGLVKYDGNRFINYRIRDNDFHSNLISSFLLIVASKSGVEPGEVFINLMTTTSLRFLFLILN